MGAAGAASATGAGAGETTGAGAGDASATGAVGSGVGACASGATSAPLAGAAEVDCSVFAVLLEVVSVVVTGTSFGFVVVAVLSVTEVVNT